MIDVARSADPQVRAILARHAKVSVVEEGPHGGIDFAQGDWHRSVLAGDPSAPICGLVELMDNNPLVCADVASVPSVAGTLALIALGPLAWAGMITEPPAFTCFGADEADVSPWLATAGWHEGVTTHFGESADPNVLSAVAMAAIRTPEDWTEIDDVFDERYARSFFVRRDEASEWSFELVRNQPFATYRLRYTPDEPTSLLTISVLADRNGKCGAAQVVHCMNVMAGFEESLGLD